MSFPLFPALCLELQSHCNRECSFCWRTHDRSGLRNEADGTPVRQSMPTHEAERILHESHALGFRGPVYFYLYSEPFLDDRLIEMATLARSCGMSPRTATNGDALRSNQRLLDEAVKSFDSIRIGLYEADTQAKHDAEVASWRRLLGAKADFSSLAGIGPRPGNMLAGDANRTKESCPRVGIMLIVTYDGRSPICCYDTHSEFDLPNAFNTSVKDLWWHPNRISASATLAVRGGRNAYRPCRSCCMPASDPVTSLGWAKAPSLRRKP